MVKETLRGSQPSQICGKPGSASKTEKVALPCGKRGATGSGTTGTTGSPLRDWVTSKEEVKSLISCLSSVTLQMSKERKGAMAHKYARISSLGPPSSSSSGDSLNDSGGPPPSLISSAVFTDSLTEKGPQEPSLSSIMQLLQVQKAESQQHYVQVRADNTSIHQALLKDSGKVTALATEALDLQQRVSSVED
ncbi:hypothetical protein NDU88_004929 [Pleurodeles waltl]|uniref:Uncharacterized protein n=1 Tax=Pleurodeles waltl TaxID=8319 RepID=A0AAV7LMR3_PLEWA|nr:hypothetical protein NDU88_004929 [Pleurodeles waltl]